MGNFSPGGSNVEFHSERSQHFCCPLKVNVIECGGGSGGWGGGTGLSRIITSSKVYTEIRLAAKKKQLLRAVSHLSIPPSYAEKNNHFQMLSLCQIHKFCNNQ